MSQFQIKSIKISKNIFMLRQHEINIKKHYVYKDKFTLNVLYLTQKHLATEEDKAYKIDCRAKLFEAKKALAKKNAASIACVEK